MKRLSPHFILWLLIWGMCSLSLGQTTGKKTIAVIDLDTRGAVSKAEAGTLTDRLRSTLVLTGVFNIVERGKMEAILKEQGFQLTGCTSTECAVEIGRILNVQEMVTGSVGKVGATFTIDIVSVDVETSRIIKSLTHNYKGKLDGLLGIVEEMAVELARKGPLQTTPIKPITPVPKKKGNKAGLWIAGGVVVTGVAVAAIIFKGTSENSDLPGPETIWPPRNK